MRKRADEGDALFLVVDDAMAGEVAALVVLVVALIVIGSLLVLALSLITMLCPPRPDPDDDDASPSKRVHALARAAIQRLQMAFDEIRRGLRHTFDDGDGDGGAGSGGGRSALRGTPYRPLSDASGDDVERASGAPIVAPLPTRYGGSSRDAASVRANARATRIVSATCPVTSLATCSATSPIPTPVNAASSGDGGRPTPQPPFEAPREAVPAAVCSQPPISATAVCSQPISARRAREADLAASPLDRALQISAARAREAALAEHAAASEGVGHAGGGPGWGDWGLQISAARSRAAELYEKVTGDRVLQISAARSRETVLRERATLEPHSQHSRSQSPHHYQPPYPPPPPLAPPPSQSDLQISARRAARIAQRGDEASPVAEPSEGRPTPGAMSVARTPGSVSAARTPMSASTTARPMLVLQPPPVPHPVLPPQPVVPPQLALVQARSPPTTYARKRSSTPSRMTLDVTPAPRDLDAADAALASANALANVRSRLRAVSKDTPRPPPSARAMQRDSAGHVSARSTGPDSARSRNPFLAEARTKLRRTGEPSATPSAEPWQREGGREGEAARHDSGEAARHDSPDALRSC